MSQQWQGRINNIFDVLYKTDGNGEDQYKYSQKIDENSSETFGDIDSKIDGENNPLTGLSNLISIYTKGSLWNESMNALALKLQEMYEESDNSENKEFLKRYKQVLDANAGFSFSGTPYVKPNFNIDGDAYDKVRGIDKLDSVLQNSKELQYTHTQDQVDNMVINKYIRLLMPKYIRRVEVEDLNRNFWVIAQTVGIISAYLLEPSSALNEVLGGIIGELTEIWNNIFELWALCAQLDGKIKDTQNIISELGRSSKKTNLKIHLNTDAIPSISNFIMGEAISGNFSDRKAPSEVVLNDLFFFGAVEKSGNALKLSAVPSWITNEKEAIKAAYPWLYDSSDNFIYNTNSSKWKNVFYRQFTTKDYCCPRIGGIIKFTYNNIVNYLAYDVDHPFICPEEYLRSFYGLYYYMNKIEDGGQTYFQLNNVLADHLNDNLSSQTSNSVGNIEIDREKYDSRPIGEIVQDVLQLNLTLAALTPSGTDIPYVCVWDKMPDQATILNQDLQKIAKYWLISLEDYLLSSSEASSSQNGQYLRLEFSVLPKINALFNQKLDLAEYNFNILMGAFKNNDIRKKYKTYLSNKNADTYFDLLNSLLKLINADIQTFIKEKEINITEDNLNNYLDEYEQWALEKAKSKNLIEILIGTNSYDYYSTSNPFNVINFDGSLSVYAQFDNFFYETDSSGGRKICDYWMKYCGKGQENTWRCFMTLYPKEIFVNGYDLQYDENTTHIEKKSFNNFSANSSYTLPMYKKSLFHNGALQAFSMTGDVRNRYLVPFKDFHGYWVSITQGSYASSFLHSAPRVSQFSLKLPTGLTTRHIYHGSPAARISNFYDVDFTFAISSPYSNSDNFVANKISDYVQINEPNAIPRFGTKTLSYLNSDNMFNNILTGYPTNKTDSGLVWGRGAIIGRTYEIKENDKVVDTQKCLVDGLFGNYTGNKGDDYDIPWYSNSLRGNIGKIHGYLSNSMSGNSDAENALSLITNLPLPDTNGENKWEIVRNFFTVPVSTSTETKNCNALCSFNTEDYMPVVYNGVGSLVPIYSNMEDKIVEWNRIKLSDLKLGENLDNFVVKLNFAIDPKIIDPGSNTLICSPSIYRQQSFVNEKPYYSDIMADK